MNGRFDNLAKVHFFAEQTKLPLAGKQNFPEPSHLNDRPPNQFTFFVVGRSFKDKKS